MEIIRRMRWRLEKFDSYAERMRRSSREIIVASVLTLAAFAFLLAALLGGAVKGTDVGHIAAEEAVIK
jgi:hypothetical protein